MNNVDSMSEITALLLGLAVLHDPVRTRALSQFVRGNESAILNSLQRLETAGLVRQDTTSRLWFVENGTARITLGKNGTAKLGQDGHSPLARGLALLVNGQVLDGVEALVPALRGLIVDGLTAGALVCLDILLHALGRWADSGEHSKAEQERFLVASKTIIGVVLYLTKRRRRPKALVASMEQVAESMGDVRSVLRLKLLLLCIHQLVGNVLEEDPRETLRKVTEQAQDLGDRDILTAAAHGRGMYQYINGEFIEVLENYRHFIGRHNADDTFYSGIASNTVAITACNLGRFGTALGTVHFALKYFTEEGSKYAVKRSKVLGALVLLRSGNPDKALEMLDEVWPCLDTESETRLAIWSLRILALYHYQKRNMVFSHRLLTQCAQLTARYDIQHNYQWFPDIFEMLWTFQELGFPPIPRHGLEDLLDDALEGPSVHCEGIALRIRARQLIANRHFQTALPPLETGLAKFEQCRDVVEHARTRLVMAEALKGLDRHDEAQAALRAGVSVLEQYHQYDRHWHGLKGVFTGGRKSRTDGLRFARTCREMAFDVPDWPTGATRLQNVIDLVRDELNVERVAVYGIENEYELACLVARNFTPAEYTDTVPSLYGKRLLDCARSGRVLRWRSRYGAVLCLPLRISDKQRGVFFAQCTYLVEAITGQDADYLGAVAELLEEEIRTNQRVSQGVQASQHWTETQSRLAAERMGEGGGIYYGPSMRESVDIADKAAPTPAPVLILGETGAGKEELSRRVHRKSGRSGPFVVVNPSSIPETLFESELFGHEKGAFTGAHQQKIGLVELADKGTLFIDEIGEVSPAMQVKLLRVLQDKTFSRVGGTSLLHSDFRLISATNQDLKEKIGNGTFREDFYYRIAVMPIVMPPLRERPEDIRNLALHFHTYFSTTYKKALPPLTEEELEYLCSRTWSGNVRELKSFIERGVILFDPARGGFIQEAVDGEPVPSAPLSEPSEVSDTPEFACSDLPSMDEMHRRYLAHVLQVTRGKVGGETGAEGILKIKASSLYKQLKKYGLDKTTQLYGRVDTHDP